MPEDLALVELFERLAMALGIGFLIGVERGWRHRDAVEGTRAAGLRTHAIAGLFGGVTGALTPFVGPVGFAVLTLGFCTAFIVFKVSESREDRDISVTGTLAGLLVFALGAFAVLGDMRVAAAVGVTLALLLAFKDALHSWLDKLTWQEIRSALIILAATAIALPILPDRTVDPWGAINPRELWLLTIFVASASFAGYIAVRALGASLGLIAGAGVGSLVSSTVVTADLGRRVRRDEATALTAASGASLAAAVSVIRVLLFVGATAGAVLPLIGPTLATAALVFAAAVWVLSRAADARGDSDGATTLHSPLELMSVGRFALLLAGIIVLGRIISQTFGQAGLLPFAATAGLADVDAVTLAAGSLVRRGIEVDAAANAILIAVLVNTFAKGVIAGVTGGARYAAWYLGAALAATAAAAAVWFFAASQLAAGLSQ
ncbi:MAG: DUF4010 domain-containing protein [Hyphomonadaceae bacterium]|nr:DUF4010 domain-containing protein [Hyphomonadaceae bacterium]